MENEGESSKIKHTPPATESFGSLSRRDFIRLNLAMLALAGTSSCERPEEPRDDRSHFGIIRPDDLLALRFDLRNLRIEHRRRETARLVRIRRGEDALVIISFPGQHILEQAFPAGICADPIKLPVKSRMARPARLVFKIPPDRNQIELTFGALLDWRDWIPLLPASGSGELDVPAPAERSIIEMPYGLSIFPDEAARWSHSARPVTRNGRTELWHTRLLSEDPQKPLILKIEQPDYRVQDLVDAETSLVAADRAALAGKTAEARTLLLSPMGGWLDVRGKWGHGASISRWHHTFAAGQDQQVVVQREEGFLYPFGQRASLVTVTERRLAQPPAGSSGPALLRKRSFVAIKEPGVSYEHGRMALSRMTALDLVTPPLQNASEDKIPFWIVTESGEPFRFRFRAEDWSGRRLVLEATAIFVSESGEKIRAAKDQYDRRAYMSRRIVPLHGQPAAVARYAPKVGACEEAADASGFGCDRWGDPLSEPRSAGDTTLHMLQIEFSGADDPSPAQAAVPFSCLTGRMQVRVPSLEPYLSEERNKGWFDLVDPDALHNLGEVFARARKSDGPAIPMYFDEQADRCGGVAAPSFDVDGISRVRGPVGDTGPMYEGGRFDPGKYFKAGRANLLGGFSLTELAVGGGGAKSPAVPKIRFVLSRIQPEEKAAEKGARSHWEVGLGLNWNIGISGLGSEAARLVPLRDGKDDSPKARLLLDAKITKTLGRSESPGGVGNGAKTEKDGREAGPGKAEGGDRNPKSYPVQWRVSGKITQFAIELRPDPLGWISIAFEHFGVAFGPPKPKSENGKQEKDENKDDNREKTESVELELDYRMAGIQAGGMLGFVVKLIQLAAGLPQIPDLSVGEASTAYPAKLPDVGDADLSVTVGPISAPKFKWLNFEVTNAAASFGVGLYFLPRRLKASEPPAVPDNLFTIRVASADKPLTLVSTPWGGIAHLGFNFTPRGLTGFQGSLGIVYRVEFDLGAAKGKCEGSVAGVFTYEIGDGSGPRHQFALVLKLSGQAAIAGFIDIHLSLTAVGVWQSNLWGFSAEIDVRVKIGFFAVSVRFRFEYTLSDGGGDRRRLAAAGADETEPLNRDDWLTYWSAFAEEM